MQHALHDHNFDMGHTGIYDEEGDELAREAFLDDLLALICLTSPGFNDGNMDDFVPGTPLSMYVLGDSGDPITETVHYQTPSNEEG